MSRPRISTTTSTGGGVPGSVLDPPRTKIHNTIIKNNKFTIRQNTQLYSDKTIKFQNINTSTTKSKSPHPTAKSPHPHSKITSPHNKITSLPQQKQCNHKKRPVLPWHQLIHCCRLTHTKTRVNFRRHTWQSQSWGGKTEKMKTVSKLKSTQRSLSKLLEETKFSVQERINETMFLPATGNYSCRKQHSTTLVHRRR